MPDSNFNWKVTWLPLLIVLYTQLLTSFLFFLVSNLFNRIVIILQWCWVRELTVTLEDIHACFLGSQYSVMRVFWTVFLNKSLFIFKSSGSRSERSKRERKRKKKEKESRKEEEGQKKERREEVQEGGNLLSHLKPSRGLPRWLSGKEFTCQCRSCRFDPWVGKIPWRRKGQPTAVFLPGEFREQRSLVG